MLCYPWHACQSQLACQFLCINTIASCFNAVYLHQVPENILKNRDQIGFCISNFEGVG